MKHWRVMVLVAGLWLCVVLYLTKPLPTDVETADNRFENSWSRVRKELLALSQQNQELWKLVKLRNNVASQPCPQTNVVDNVQTRFAHSPNEFSQTREYSSNNLTYEAEHARRKAENTVNELWYFVDSLLRTSDALAGNQAPKLSELKETLEGYKRTMLGDFDKLRKANKADEYRDQRSQELGDLVQRRLEYLQNPADCKVAKKIICSLSAPCGFGCQMHHAVFCLITAYAMQRSLVLMSLGWNYAGGGGWETVFEPVSKTCTVKSIVGNSTIWKESQEYMSKFDNIYLVSINFLYPRPKFLPLAVPADLVHELSIIHGDPAVWWVGQILRYLFRLKPHILHDVIRTGEKMGFKNTIVGVHIRRTDKVNQEAAFHSLDEYMYHVKEYYDQAEWAHPGITRRVYIATDDPEVLAEAHYRYPTYRFIYDRNSSESAALNTRYTQSSLQGIITDTYYLARCDYLVCTFSSQVCRLAYELMQTLRGDAAKSFHSLDDMYYFGGQFDHHLKAVEAHRSSRAGFMEMLPGDVIGIAGNHWDGFSQGLNRRTSDSGLFPSYKAENVVIAAEMPTYPEVPLKVN